MFVLAVLVLWINTSHMTMGNRHCERSEAIYNHRIAKHVMLDKRRGRLPRNSTAISRNDNGESPL